MQDPQSNSQEFCRSNVKVVFCFRNRAVLSVRFEVGVSLLLAPSGADKRGPKAPFL